MLSDTQLGAVEQPPGSITIAEKVVAKLASRAALELPDAAAAARRGLGRSMPKASARVEGDVAVIDLEIGVRWPASVPRVTAAVRRHVRERLTSLTGLTIAEVRIVVTDLATGIPSLRVR
ncbi:Asp23/Gls24 family envelope stress response protein [Dactylosporangium sp. NPDC000244]|uniref:Asp23/Gls24 family envelope stress response protein n=1 Tax=Dactylosporangium sp. NPDC000244 TaxID=3154365 RepID=UPI003325EFA1